MNDTTKIITLIAGTLLGAFLGYKVASTFVEQAEQDGKFPITPSQGLQVGITALGAMKQISGISKNKF